MGVNQCCYCSSSGWPLWPSRWGLSCSDTVTAFRGRLTNAHQASFAFCCFHGAIVSPYAILQFQLDRFWFTLFAVMSLSSLLVLRRPWPWPCNSQGNSPQDPFWIIKKRPEEMLKKCARWQIQCTGVMGRPRSFWLGTLKESSLRLTHTSPFRRWRASCNVMASLCCRHLVSRWGMATSWAICFLADRVTSLFPLVGRREEGQLGSP